MSNKKRQAMRRAGVLHPRPDRVGSPLFERIPFFDSEDKLQVKYEMLRSHHSDHLTISGAAELFGYSRQAYYQIQEAFEREGLTGLLEKKRGRKGPTKCTPEVVAFLLQEKQSNPELSGRELAARLLEQRGVEVHRRTVEKIVAGLGPRRRAKRKRSKTS